MQTKRTVWGKGPIAYHSDRKQIYIPLSSLVFVDGTLQPADETAFKKAFNVDPKSKSLLSWLSRLGAAGFVKQGAPIDAPGPTQVGAGASTPVAKQGALVEAPVPPQAGTGATSPPATSSKAPSSSTKS